MGKKRNTAGRRKVTFLPMFVLHSDDFGICIQHESGSHGSTARRNSDVIAYLLEEEQGARV